MKPDQVDAMTPRHGRANALAIDTDGWMDLLWPGQWEHPQGPQAVDSDDIQTTYANIRAQAAALGESWGGVPVYVGHPEVDGTMAAAPAVAWIKEFRISPAGRLQGNPRWVGNARADLVDSGAYKYISCYEYGESDPVGVFHTAYISTVALTNAPVKLAGQKPLANAKGTETMTPPAAPASPTPPAPGNPPTVESGSGGSPIPPEFLAGLANALGCPADVESVQARCNAVAGEMQALRTEIETLLLEQAVATGAVKDAPDARANALALLRADRKAAAAHFASGAGRAGTMRPRDPLAGDGRPVRVNAIAGDPDGVADAVKRAKAIRARANALLGPCGGNWDAAWSRAEAEIASDESRKQA